MYNRMLSGVAINDALFISDSDSDKDDVDTGDALNAQSAPVVAAGNQNPLNDDADDDDVVFEGPSNSNATFPMPMHCNMDGLVKQENDCVSENPVMLMLVSQLFLSTVYCSLFRDSVGRQKVLNIS